MSGEIEALKKCGADARCAAFAAVVSGGRDAVAPLVAVVSDEKADGHARTLSAQALAELKSGGEALLDAAKKTRDVGLQDAFVASAGATGTPAVFDRISGLDVRRLGVRRALAFFPERALKFGVDHIGDDPAREGAWADLARRVAAPKHEALLTDMMEKSSRAGARRQLQLAIAGSDSVRLEALATDLQKDDALVTVSTLRGIGEVCSGAMIVPPKSDALTRRVLGRCAP